MANVRSELRSGDPHGALATLNQLQSTFPKGGLMQEREVLSVEVLAANRQSAARLNAKLVPSSRLTRRARTAPSCSVSRRLREAFCVTLSDAMKRRAAQLLVPLSLLSGCDPRLTTIGASSSDAGALDRGRQVTPARVHREGRKRQADRPVHGWDKQSKASGLGASSTPTPAPAPTTRRGAPARAEYVFYGQRRRHVRDVGPHAQPNRLREPLLGSGRRWGLDQVAHHHWRHLVLGRFPRRRRLRHPGEARPRGRRASAIDSQLRRQRRKLDRPRSFRPIRRAPSPKAPPAIRPTPYWIWTAACAPSCGSLDGLCERVDLHRHRDVYVYDCPISCCPTPPYFNGLISRLYALTVIRKGRCQKRLPGQAGNKRVRGTPLIVRTLHDGCPLMNANFKTLVELWERSTEQHGAARAIRH